MSAADVLLGLSVVLTGLMAGLWYAWTVSVIPGTRLVGDTTYVETMQRINRAILNPGFLVPFIGIPVVLAVAAWLQFRAGDDRRGWLLAASAATYVVGVLGVTAGGNVPLNDALDEFDLAGADDEARRDRRTTYEQPWNRLHYVRTVGNLVAFVLATAAAVVDETD